MTLTSSKAHDQFMPVLAKIPDSLTMFGHVPTEVVFTDNVRADKHELEKIFPSLLKDVIPVPPYSTFEPLKLPECWTVVPLTSTHQVNMRMNIIMSHHTDIKPVITSFDMQFPVDGSTGIRGLVALIQIAYDKTVYLIQVPKPVDLFLITLITSQHRHNRTSMKVTSISQLPFSLSCIRQDTRRLV